MTRSLARAPIAGIIAVASMTFFVSAAGATTPRTMSGSSAWTSTVPLATVPGDDLVIRRAGTAHVLAGLGRNVTELVWSADASHLALEQQDAAGASLTTLSAAGTGLDKVATGATVSFAWSGRGDGLYYSVGVPFAATSRVELRRGNGVTSTFATVRGTVLDITASPSIVAVSSAAYHETSGFSSAELALYSVASGHLLDSISSMTTAYDAVSFSPTGTSLLVGLDEDSSASLAEDGVEYETVSSSNGTTHRIGVGLENPAWQSWAATGATLAITLGDSRAAWATNKHVALCRFGGAGACDPVTTAPGTISFAPSYGTGGRIALTTATGLGGGSGFGKNAPSGARAAAKWNSTFHVWTSSGSSSFRELTGLSGAGYPQWVDGGPGLLIEDGGALWYFSAPGAKGTRITNAFVQTGYGNYGSYDFAAQYAVAP